MDNEGVVNFVSSRYIAQTGDELASFLNQLDEIPSGKTYNGSFYKSISKNAEETYNAQPDIISEHSIEESWGRYDTKGESGMYYSKTLNGNETEMSFYGDWDSYSTYQYNNVQVDDMLDLTDDVVRQKLGIQFDDLVRNKISVNPDDVKTNNYEMTNVIGSWARSKGYKGIIFNGARGNHDYTNIIVFEQSDLTNALSSASTPVKIK